MHRIFQNFIDLLATAKDAADFSEALSKTATALELTCFAYLSLPSRIEGAPRLISSYPERWTSHYLQSRYERIDPVIEQALRTPEPFQWGVGLQSVRQTRIQKKLLDEAAQFGLRVGFTVPIHDGRGPVAALTFAAEKRNPVFDGRVKSDARVLQLMAMFFHAHVRRRLAKERYIAGVPLSPRELECLEWASQGKSAWEIGRILGISRHTAASYLDSAKEKLGVKTVVQAALRLAAVKREEQN
jgi:DNA-binding CsgD family transcriptional regulator